MVIVRRMKIDRGWLQVAVYSWREGWFRLFGYGLSVKDARRKDLVFSDRNRLGPIALTRAAAHAGRNFTTEETWVIGDTPKDIACAHAMGARCLAVSTGRFTAAELQVHRPDRVVESLDQALEWI